MTIYEVRLTVTLTLDAKDEEDAIDQLDGGDLLNHDYLNKACISVDQCDLDEIEDVSESDEDEDEDAT